MISAPYNFVPLSRKVFNPSWHTLVSQDIPFSDGISGEIVCELITEAPIYVRNGVPPTGGCAANDAHARDEACAAFFNVGGRYMIPGTGLRGVFRNVLEIMSFGKMQRADDHRYGVRDLRAHDLYTKFMTKPVVAQTYEPRVKAGWLELDGDGEHWRIIPCSFARVEQDDLKRFGATFNRGQRLSAVEKYHLWTGDLGIAFDLEADTTHPHRRGTINLVYLKVNGATLKPGTKGTVVLTGQPGPSKHMEFVFYDEQPQPIDVPEDVQRDFKFIHSDPNGRPNEEWGFWRAKLNGSDKRAPIFYLFENGQVSSIGLAMMYRLPYKRTVRDLIWGNADAHKPGAAPDLADVIFGFVPDKGGDVSQALKGRVAFSAAEAQGTVNEMPRTETVLGSPKPTYYPNYIEQAGNGPGFRYKTFMDRDAVIRGWKRYPARCDEAVNLPGLPPRVASNSKVTTWLTPLPTGTCFRFTMTVHNLRPVELGALLWVLTWGGNPNLRHSFGMAKSAGYGKARVEITAKRLARVAGEVDVSDQDFLTTFVNAMNEEIPGWKTTNQLVQLCAMADPNFVPPGSDQVTKLRHMQIGQANEFVAARGRGERLEPHALYNGPTDEERFGKLQQVVPGKAPEQGKAPVAKRGGETPALRLAERFASVPRSPEGLIKFFESLAPGELALLSVVDLDQVSGTLNLGMVDKIESSSMNADVKRFVAGWVVSRTQPSKKWDATKLAKFERLKKLVQ